MNIYLFEPRRFRQGFYPITRTRDFVDLLYGGFTLRQEWEKALGSAGKLQVLTEDYLQGPVAEFIEPGDILIHAGMRPGSIDEIFAAGHSRENGIGIQIKGSGMDTATTPEIVAVRLNERLPTAAVRDALSDTEDPHLALMRALVPQGLIWNMTTQFDLLDSPEALLRSQGAAIEKAVARLTEEKLEQGAAFQVLHGSNRVLGEYPVLIDAGANVKMAVLNAENGPVYIGKNATVMEGAMIRGPFFLGNGATVKMGTKIYGAVVTGENCVLGGELKNVVFHDGSNKGHDGYLGDSIIGSWCNFGAGSGGSNLKNTGGRVRLYDYARQQYRDAGIKFGAMVGDYTRIGVGTQLTTGSSIGVCCNLFGQQMPPNLVRDFSWGTGHHLDDYQVQEAIEHIRRWMDFKHAALGDREIQILHHIFDQTGGRD